MVVQWFCWALAAYVLFQLWLLIPDGYPAWLYVGTLFLLIALVKAGSSTRRLCDLAAIKDRANSQLKKSQEARLLLGHLARAGQKNESTAISESLRDVGIFSSQQFRQLREIHSNPSRVLFREHLCRRAPAGLALT
jgi:hypothetical protein